MATTMSTTLTVWCLLSVGLIALRSMRTSPSLCRLHSLASWPLVQSIGQASISTRPGRRPAKPSGCDTRGRRLAPTALHHAGNVGQNCSRQFDGARTDSAMSTRFVASRARSRTDRQIAPSIPAPASAVACAASPRHRPPGLPTSPAGFDLIRGDLRRALLALDSHARFPHAGVTAGSTQFAAFVRPSGHSRVIAVH
jgi:hypothetical protein